jgi:hypothetical protein
VQPTLGRLEPGASIDVLSERCCSPQPNSLFDARPLVTMQLFEEEPPLDTKCKDKFLIQSAIITLDKENWMLKDIVRTHAAFALRTYQRSSYHPFSAFFVISGPAWKQTRRTRFLRRNSVSHISPTPATNSAQRLFVPHYGGPLG